MKARSRAGAEIDHRAYEKMFPSIPVVKHIHIDGHSIATCLDCTWRSSDDHHGTAESQARIHVYESGHTVKVVTSSTVEMSLP